MKNKVGRPAHDDILTPSEWRVLNACRHGLSNQAIADNMKISINAIKYHVRNILEKTGVANKKSLRTYPIQEKGKITSNLQEPTMQIKSIGQIARTVANAEASKNWYEVVLELPHLYSFGPMAFFSCNGTRLMLQESSDVQAHESIIYFNVYDIFGTYESLQKKGVECVSAPHKIHVHEDGTEEWMAFFKDLEDRPLALIEQIKPTSN